MRVIWKTYQQMGWTEEATRALAVFLYGPVFGAALDLKKFGATVVVGVEK